jgi:hypothetical protein
MHALIGFRRIGVSGEFGLVVEQFADGLAVGRIERHAAVATEIGGEIGLGGPDGGSRSGG